MAKVHTYTKFVETPSKVITVHLADDEEPETFPEELSTGNWKEIGACVETVSQVLENSRPGSKFPLFHRIGGETPISKLEVDLLSGELDKIKTLLKKQPLSESRIVKFRKGKTEVKQLTEKELESFKGLYKGKDESAAKNLYESFKHPIDLHVKMCRQAKKSATGLHWKVVDSRQLKKARSKTKPATAKS